MKAGLLWAGTSLAAFFSLCLPEASTAQAPAAELGGHAAAPVARTLRTTQPITVDGRLDEAAWAAAPVITEFRQIDPQEGAPVSERTEVRILFSGDALFVGAKLYDREAVSRRLARRDAPLIDSDWFAIALDSYHDHLTAFRFAINPAGVRRDEVLSGGGGGQGRRAGRGEGDDSWDPVWEANTIVTDSGWVAEMRIPFSQLRFSRADVQTWGVQLERRISRRQEHAVFAFTPKRERAGVARYGHLTGIEGIRASQRLEILPYAVAQAQYRHIALNAAVDFPDPYRTGSDYGAGAGVDVKYRVSPNFTLDATFNPDFGQVEVDPAEVNLTAFETRFQETRPFLGEGGKICGWGGGGGGGDGGGGGGEGGGTPQLLYSRRIGRAPQGLVPQEAVYASAPTTSTILGAAKLTGRTAGGWSLGLLNAVTAREEAPYVDALGFQRRAVVEPLSNYFTGRLRRDLRAGQTTVGAIFNAANRSLDEDLSLRLRSAAYAGGIDFRQEWANRTWSANGYVSSSYILGREGVIIASQRSSARYFQRPDARHLEVDSAATSLAGYAARLDVGKRAGTWQGGVALSTINPSYEVNDLGFQMSADRVSLDANLSYEHNQPGRIFRRWSMRGGPDATWSYGGDLVGAGVGASASGQLTSYWSGLLRFGHQFRSLNDRLTRGGPLTQDPAGNSLSAFASSDFRKAYTLTVLGNLGWDEAGAWRASISPGLGLKPASNWDVRVGPNISRSRSVAQYVTTVTDTLATRTFGRRYIFADLEQTTLGLETRVNVTFTRGLTLEMYAQPFFSSGDYEGLKELHAPRTSQFDRYGSEVGTLARDARGAYTVDPDGSGPARTFQISDRDFNFRSLRGNAVLRWEWRPGSTLFLVWQQSRSESLTALSSDSAYGRVGNFDLNRDARELFGLKPDNIFVLKVNYWLNP